MTTFPGKVKPVHSLGSIGMPLMVIVNTCLLGVARGEEISLSLSWLRAESLSTKWLAKMTSEGALVSSQYRNCGYMYKIRVMD